MDTEAFFRGLECVEKHHSDYLGEMKEKADKIGRKLERARVLERQDDVNRLNFERLSGELADHKCKISALKDVIREAEMKCNVDNVEIKRLKDEVAADKVELATLKQRVIDFEKELARERAGVIELKHKLMVADKEVAGLKSDRSELLRLGGKGIEDEQELERLRGKGIEDEEELARLRAKGIEDEEELARLADDAARDTAELQRLKQAVTVMATEMKAAELKAARDKKEMERLRREVMDTRKEVAKLKVEQSELARQKDRVILLEDELRDADEEAAELKVDRSELARQNVKVVRLKEDLRDADDEIEVVKFDPSELEPKQEDEELELTRLEENTDYGEMESRRHGRTDVIEEHLKRKRQKTSDYKRDEDICIYLTGLGRSITLNVKDSLTVAAVKDYIHNHDGMPSPEEQRLIYEGKVLKDSDTLYDCGISQSAQMEMEWTFLGPITIFVSDELSKYKISLDVKRSDTIEKVKGYIYRKCRTTMRHQCLIHQSKRGRNDSTLVQLGVDRNSTVYFSGYLGLDISVKDANGETIQLRNIPGWEAISLVKDLIQTECDTPILQQKLMYKGVELRDDHTLVNCAINDHSTLDMVCGIIRPVELCVRDFILPMGRTIILKAKRSETVAEVKARIHLVHGPPVEQQALLGKCFRDEKRFWETSLQPLDDKRTLGEYRFPKETKLDLITGGALVDLIAVKILQGQSGTQYATLPVFSSSTVRELKARISQEENITVTDQMTLLCGDVQLEDGHTLARYKIKDRSTLELRTDPIE